MAETTSSEMHEDSMLVNGQSAQPISVEIKKPGGEQIKITIPMAANDEKPKTTTTALDDFLKANQAKRSDGDPEPGDPAAGEPKGPLGSATTEPGDEPKPGGINFKEVATTEAPANDAPVAEAQYKAPPKNMQAAAEIPANQDAANGNVAAKHVEATGAELQGRIEDPAPGRKVG